VAGAVARTLPIHVVVQVKCCRMTRQEAMQIARLRPYFQGAYDTMTLAFVQRYESIYIPLGKPPTMTANVDLVKLGVGQNDQRARESGREACLYHLRNCFAHARLAISVANSTTIVELRDQNHGGKTTFTAKCDKQVLIDLANEILITGHKAQTAAQRHRHRILRRKRRRRIRNQNATT
jgi:hypothetical protein